MNRRSSLISPAVRRPFSTNAAGRFASVTDSRDQAFGANRYFGYFYFFFFYAFTAAGGMSM